MTCHDLNLFLFLFILFLVCSFWAFSFFLSLLPFFLSRFAPVRSPGLFLLWFFPCFFVISSFLWMPEDSEVANL